MGSKNALGQTNAVTTSTTAPPSYLSDAYKNLVNNSVATGTSAYTPYTGGFNADQQTAFQQLRNQAATPNSNFGAAAGTFGQAGQTFGQAGDTFGQAKGLIGNSANTINSATGSYNSASGALNSSLTPLYSTVGSYMSPFISNVANSVVANMNELNGQQQQQLLGNAITQGALGGNRVGVAQSELARQQGLTNNQTISQLWEDAYNNALGANEFDKTALINAGTAYTGVGNGIVGQGTALTGVGNAMTNVGEGQTSLGASQTNLGTAQTNLGTAATNAQLATTGALLGAGTQQQQFDYSQYLNGQAFPYQQGQWLAGQLGTVGPLAGGTTTQQTPDGNWISDLVGLGTTAVGALSDARAKEGIEPVGKTFDGQNIYKYRYKGSPQTQMGLVRRRVAGKHPDAVSSHGGLLHVDYDRATSGAAERGHFAAGGATPQELASKLNATAGLVRARGGHVPYNAGADVYTAPAFANDNDIFSTYLPEAMRANGSFHAPTIQDYHTDDSGTSLTPIGALTKGIANMNRARGGMVRPSMAFGGDPTMDSSMDDPTLVAQADNPAVGGISMALPDVLPNGGARGLVIPAPSRGAVDYAPSNAWLDRGATDKSYSQNLGDVLKSIGAGNGLGLSPDANQGLIAAGAATMAGGHANGFRNLGQGILAGQEKWMQLQDLARNNAVSAQDIANQRSGTGLQSILDEQAGQNLYQNAQVNAANIANQRTTYERSGLGWNKVVTAADGTKTVTRVPWSQVPVDQGGGAPAAAPSLPQGGLPAQPQPQPQPAAGGAPSAPAAPQRVIGGLPIPPDGVPDIVNNPNVLPIAANTDEGLAGLQADGRAIVAPAMQQAVQARTLDTSLGQLAALVKDMPQSGPLVQGAGFSERMQAVNAINTTLQAFGVAPMKPEELATAEGLKKLTTQLNLAVADQATSDPGIGTILHSASASPSGENTPQGILHIIGNLMAVNKRIQDRATYLSTWSSKNAAIMQTTQGTADDFFGATHPPQDYIAYGNAMSKYLTGVPISEQEYNGLPSGTPYIYNGKTMRKP